jgi:hemerythrin superfamily protein
MDAIELLKNDHDAVEELFQRFSDGGGLTGVVKRLTGNGEKPGQRRAIAAKICQELHVHAEIEEQIFYPAVRKLRDDELDEMLDEAEKEHGTIKERVSATEQALDDEDELKTRVSSLQDCVTHHVREEEGEMFPRLEELMPEAERSRLGRDLAAAKRDAKTAMTELGRSTALRGSGSGRARKTTAKAGKSTAGVKRASGARRR